MLDFVKIFVHRLNIQKNTYKYVTIPDRYSHNIKVANIFTTKMGEF